MNTQRSYFLLALLITFVLGGALFAQTKTAVAKRSTTAKSAGTAPAANLPTEQTVNDFMQHTFGYDPSLKWKIVQIKPSEVPNMADVIVQLGDPPRTWTLYVTPDAHFAFASEPIPFGNDPFGSVRRELQSKAKGPVRGAANATVTIVEFSDLQCPHCKLASPTLERLVSEVPNTRLVFENFPIEQIHKWAGPAARTADCIAHTNGNEVFWRFVDAVFNQQEQISGLAEQDVPNKISEITKSVGADPGATTTCADSATAKANVIQSYELGQSLGVTGTPTLFINGRKISNVNSIPYEQLKEIVQYEAQQGNH